MTFIKDVTMRRKHTHTRWALLTGQLEREQAKLAELDQKAKEATASGAASSNTPNTDTTAQSNAKSEDGSARTPAAIQKTIVLLESKLKDLVEADKLFGDLDKSPLPVYLCNGCNKQIAPDAGHPMENRYHCTECYDFDLCRECFLNKGGHTHQMYPEALNMAEEVYQETLRLPTSSAMLADVLKRYAHRPAVGVRRSKGILASTFSYLSYRDIDTRVRNLAAALFGPLGLKAGDFVSVCAPNCPDWVIVDMALLIYGLVPVPMIPAIRPEHAAQIVAKSKVSVAFCTPGHLPIFQALPELKAVILMDDDFLFQEVPKDLPSQVRILSEVEKTGAGLPSPGVVVNRGKDDMVFVQYTSGSTGTSPKGAIITEAMWKSTIQARFHDTGDPFLEILKDSFSHLSERETFYCYLINGGRMGISTSNELVFEDIKILSPTRVSTTPRFFNVILSEYQRQFTEAEENAKKELNKPRLNDLELLKLKNQILPHFSDMLGFRLSRIALGGAYVAPKLKQFLKEAFPHVKVVEGYGTTEVGTLADDRGVLSYTVREFKLKDVPELGYLSTDKPFPRGELLVKTSTQTPGYHNNEEETAAAFDDGWFKTGDVVELTGNRQVRIIDRVKNFFKLSQGEYITPESVENVYSQSPFVFQCLVTHADLSKFEQNAVSAIIVPVEKTTLAWAATHSKLQALKLSSLQQLVANQESVTELKKKILEDLVTVANKNQLRLFEIPVGIIIESSQWTIENGKMTSSAKLARPVIRAAYKQQLDQLWEAGETQQSSRNSIQLAELLRDALDLPAASSATPGGTLTQLGLDSMSAVRLVHFMKDKFNVSLKAESLTSMSLDQLTSLVNPTGSVANSAAVAASSAEEVVDFAAEAKIAEESFAGAPSLPLRTSKPLYPLQKILLTGCTGFIGSFLLHEILTRSSTAVVFCFVRAASVAAGLAKVKSALQTRNLLANLPNIDSRIVVVLGDLKHPDLGLSAADAQTLRDEVDTIFHIGAYVNHVLPYKTLRTENVLATLALLRLAVVDPSRPKLFNYASSISTLTGWNKRATAPEAEIAPVASIKSIGGYAQTKWTCEHLCQAFRAKYSLDVNIIRLGMISWHTTSGVSNSEDWLEALFFGSALVGGRPPTNSVVDIVPVDTTVKILYDLSKAVAEDTNRPAVTMNLTAGTCLAYATIFAQIAELRQQEAALQELVKNKEVADRAQMHLEGLAAPTQSLKAWVQMVEAGISTARVSSEYQSDTDRQAAVRAISALLLFTRGIPDDARDVYNRANLTAFLKETQPGVSTELAISAENVAAYAKNLVARLGTFLAKLTAT